MSTGHADPSAAAARAESHPSRWAEIWHILRETASAWQADNAIRMSAAVAMYSILSLSPLLVITIKVTSAILTETEAHKQVDRQLQSFLGPKGAAAVESMITEAGQPSSGVLATIISLGVLVFTASGVFGELQGSLNAIWGIDPRTSSGWWAMIRDRLLSIGMVFSFGFLLLLTQVVSTVLTVLSEYVMGGAGWAAVAVDLIVSTAVIAVLFALIFRFLPDARVGWRYVWAGAFVTAVLFKIGQYLQALYFTYISTGSAYGAAGSFVVVMLWIYYSCWILFFGAELIKVYARRHGHPIGPVPGATKVGGEG